jgi:hypothetical protein
MMANDSGICPEAILNPYTPLAFLPPEFAASDKYEIICYMHVATLAVSLFMHCIAKKIILGLSAYRLTLGIGS